MKKHIGTGLLAVITILLVVAGVYFYSTPAIKEAGSAKTSCDTETAVYAPEGNSEFSAGEDIPIHYCFSPTTKEIFNDSYIAELYLLQIDGSLVGYIGEVGINSAGHTFDQEKLMHNAGLDFTFQAPPTGQYRILILVREKRKFEPGVARDYPVDSWDGSTISEVQDLAIDSAISPVFRINSFQSPSSLTVISPPGDESWKIGDTMNIRWEIFDAPDSVRILLRKKEGSRDVFWAFLDRVPASQKEYQWVIKQEDHLHPITPDEEYRIEVAYDNPFDNLQAFSDSFYIDP